MRTLLGRLVVVLAALALAALVAALVPVDGNGGTSPQGSVRPAGHSAR